MVFVIDRKNNTSYPSITGQFQTAPDSKYQKDVISFIVGGDLGGQKYCQRIGLGYPIFSVMRNLSPDFFIFNGDQICADSDCPAKGHANVTECQNISGNFSSISDKNTNWSNIGLVQNIYNKHWEYNRSDKHLRDLLSNISLYSQADDHEVINNYDNWSYWNNSTKNRSDYKNLIHFGIKAFFNFSPMDKTILTAL